MKDISTLISEEEARQQRVITLIASENHTSKAVRAASATLLTDKYSEGYPGRRYYAGNEVMDEIEKEAIEAAQAAFRTDYHVNVQPYAGSVANLAVYAALLQPGDTILAMALDQGGHLSHGHPVTFVSKLYPFERYGVDPETHLIDYEGLRAKALECKPRLILVGASAYPMRLEFEKVAEISREVGAYCMADMAHYAGLIAGGVYPTPFGFADVITSTTQKTLRGPRGGIIFCKPDFAEKIDKAVFPGLQGGPHMHTIAAKAVAFREASTPAFTQYAADVVKNAKLLSYALQRRGFTLIAGGTESHMMLIDLRGVGHTGKSAQTVLERVGIITNMNSIPYDTAKPLNPSGLRIGTAAITTRGFSETAVEAIADIISTTLTTKEPPIDALRERVETLAKRHRIPGM